MSQRPIFKLNEIMGTEYLWLNQLNQPNNECFKKIDTLLFNGRFDEFMESSFEKFPCIIKQHSKSQEDNLKSVFSKEYLNKICSGDEKLPWGMIPVTNNLAARKYSKTHEKQIFDFPDDATASSKQLTQLYNDGYTVQFFQPQRFSDGLHHICAGFEFLFGSLAGSSAYLTPPRTQGLAPHWDDVEVFIFQTEGTKLWHLWQGPLLPEEHSSDLSRDSEHLAAPPLQVLLRPGDVLYLPRGTVHEALSQDSFSTHVTVSVMQKYNVKGLVERLLPGLLQRAFDDPSCVASVALRQGLPMRLSQTLGSYAALTARGAGSDEPTKAAAARRAQRKETLGAVQQVLRALAALVAEEDVDAAADVISDDFANHRLPSPLLQASEDRATTLAKIDGARLLQSGNHKKLTGTLLRICDPQLLHHRVVDLGGASVLFMGSCEDNSRMRHMGHPPLPGAEDEDDEQDDDSDVGDDVSEDDEEEEEGSMSGGEDGDGDEGEDAMGWACLSLPARVYGIVQILEDCYEAGKAGGGDECQAEPFRHCIRFEDLVARSSQLHCSEEEVLLTVFSLVHVRG